MIRWTLAALVGLLIAAGAGYAASKIATQPIGLQSEPISAGSGLAPKAKAKPRRRPKATATPTPTPTRTATTVPTVGDDSGGHGGKGRDHPEDD